ncbi:hypothetical protein CPU09_02565 [Mammaliicoccus sciuri]|uniref:hypothetical protein n=1 Tax=Mammaliicoccus sciuri TaxID=1296 RepID=UPI0009FD4B1D|nr:hypothetical protein [Mammaliicoccus sciuri]ORI05559.1 hypothetical protein B5723_03335 [Mammaliicoccus sciuri]PCM42027.1 hypothetical protein CPU09_02565 [Mammaliicoccus sciuri]
MPESKKIIYYYYDGEGNRRPIDVQVDEGNDLMNQKHFINGILIEKPELKNNFYALVDGIEFKLN